MVERLIVNMLRQSKGYRMSEAMLRAECSCILRSYYNEDEFQEAWNTVANRPEVIQQECALTGNNYLSLESSGQLMLAVG
jgi:hypothetical protein